MPVAEQDKTILHPRQIRQNLALSQEHFGHLLGVSVKTISRWEQADHPPGDRIQLSRLAQLNNIAELGHMVYTADGFKAFLLTPLPIFKGQSAFDLMQRGDYEPVIAALAADFEGTGF